LQLAQALVDHETLDMEEVKKVIKGEPIRGIEQVINEDISRLSAPSTASGVKEA
jgi:ATP-dependent metalloprotease